MRSYKEWTAKNTELGGLLIRIKEITGEDIKDPELIRGLEAAAKEAGDEFFSFLKRVVSNNAEPTEPIVDTPDFAVQTPSLGGWRERGQGGTGPNGA
jgi:hypothetical protein|tara:strand:+ start:597 stop:887 length:291 start_codon:yes stop_codon:yes gene_type:complete